MVRPARSAPWCAAVSIPLAPPETMVSPEFASVCANRWACSRP